MCKCCVSKKSRRGYVLATTMALMFVIMATSSVVLLMIESTILSGKIEMASLERELVLKQTANDYVNLNLTEFGEKYQGLGYEIYENSGLKLTNYEQGIVIRVERESGYENFSICKIGLDDKLVEIVKQDSVIVLWRYNF